MVGHGKSHSHTFPQYSNQLALVDMVVEDSQLLPAMAIVLTSGTAGVGVGGLLAGWERAL